MPQCYVICIVPVLLTLKKPTSCPHSTFLCFVWISKHRTVISLYENNLSVFTTQTECVDCAGRSESLSTIQNNLSLQRANFWSTLTNILLTSCIVSASRVGAFYFWYIPHKTTILSSLFNFHDSGHLALLDTILIIKKIFCSQKMSVPISGARLGAFGCGTVLQAEGHAFDSRWSRWDFSSA